MEGLMQTPSQNKRKKQYKISRVKPVDQMITGRAGLSLFARYLEKTEVISRILLPRFAMLKKNKKGTSIEETFKQLFCFFMDGTSRHLSHFDHLSRDKAYAGLLGTDCEDLISSHTAKRFFGNFVEPSYIHEFRESHLDLFMWRLSLNKPEVIVLDLDPMVMDNDQAEKREGVKPTYKKRKGFNALQLTHEGFLVDTILRSGEKHSNSGDSAQKIIERAVRRIRASYSGDVPIVVHMDSGFMDQKVFNYLDKLDIAYICGGKLYGDITDMMAGISANNWNRYYGPGDIEDNRIWEYFEFGDRRGSWKKFRRAIFTRPMNEKGITLFPFARPCQVIYTNIGQGTHVDKQLKKAGFEYLLKPEGIIQCYHDRGRSELTFRTLKDFGSEQLPFKKFSNNNAYYHCMVLAFNLYECFKEDVCHDVVPISSYPQTLRRKIIDIGAKLVIDSRNFVLNIPRAIFSALDFGALWQRSNNPPRLLFE